MVFLDWGVQKLILVHSEAYREAHSFLRRGSSGSSPLSFAELLKLEIMPGAIYQAHAQCMHTQLTGHHTYIQAQPQIETYVVVPI